MRKEDERIRRLAYIVLLASLCIVLRITFGPFPNIKPLTAIFLVCLSYLGLLEGWLMMALTMVGSGLLFGFGPIVLWQVISFGVVQLVWWGTICKLMSSNRISIVLQSFLAGVFVYFYGMIISVLSATQFGSPPFIFWLNGLVFDSLHAVSTILFYPIIYHIFRRFYT